MPRKKKTIVKINIVEKKLKTIKETEDEKKQLTDEKKQPIDEKSIIGELYFDPKTGFQSPERLHKIAKEKGYSISLAKIKNFMNGIETHKVREKITNSFQSMIPQDLNKTWAIDLVDLQKYAWYNNNHAWLFNGIDMFSKKAWSIPLKTKSPPEVAQAMKKNSKAHLKLKGLQSFTVTTAQNLLDQK